MEKEVKTFHSHHSISFKHACDGIISAVKVEPNLKIIVVSTVLINLAAWFFKVTTTEWIIVIFSCFMVAVSEMANTALEATVDLITKEWREEAKYAKDVIAGGVLLSVIGAIIVGTIIFLPKVIALFA